MKKKLRVKFLISVVILYSVLIHSCCNSYDKDILVKEKCEKLVADSEKHLKTLKSDHKTEYVPQTLFFNEYFFLNDFSGARILRDISFYNSYFDLQLSSDRVQLISVLLGEKEDILIGLQRKDSISVKSLDKLFIIEDSLSNEYKKVLKDINDKL
jgi:hypothetical protein